MQAEGDVRPKRECIMKARAYFCNCETGNNARQPRSIATKKV